MIAANHGVRATCAERCSRNAPTSPAWGCGAGSAGAAGETGSSRAPARRARRLLLPRRVVHVPTLSAPAPPRPRVLPTPPLPVTTGHGQRDGCPGVPTAGWTRQDVLMRVSPFGWVPFLLFLVAALAGAAAGYAQFLAK